MQINAARREISFKIVYYGPGLSGKTTNIQVIHRKAPADRKGPLTAIATEGDRTLFFDYMPLQLGPVNGLATKFQLYSVPGQKFYDATRKLVLQGVDGVCFVADSQPDKMAENVEALENLASHLAQQGLSIESIPLVLQWNKRDLPDAMPVEDMELKLNKWGAPSIEAVAVSGEGVFPTLKKLASIVLERLAESQKMSHRDHREHRELAPRPVVTRSVTRPPVPSAPPSPPSPPSVTSVPSVAKKRSSLRGLGEVLKKLLEILFHRR